MGKNEIRGGVRRKGDYSGAQGYWGYPYASGPVRRQTGMPIPDFCFRYPSGSIRE